MSNGGIYEPWESPSEPEAPTLRGYDAWKLSTPPEYAEDRGIEIPSPWKQCGECEGWTYDDGRGGQWRGGRWSSTKGSVRRCLCNGRGK